jgi:hypothetical protein
MKPFITKLVHRISESRDRKEFEKEEAKRKRMATDYVPRTAAEVKEEKERMATKMSPVEVQSNLMPYEGTFDDCQRPPPGAIKRP